MMLKQILAVTLLFLAPSPSQAENQIDPLLPMEQVDLICGRANGLYMVFSSTLKKAWYFPADHEILARYANTERASDLNGSSAYSYQIDEARSRFPSVENPEGHILAQYRYSIVSDSSWNSHFFEVRKGPRGDLRIYILDTPYHGRCRFLR